MRSTWHLRKVDPLDGNGDDVAPGAVTEEGNAGNGGSDGTHDEAVGSSSFGHEVGVLRGLAGRVGLAVETLLVALTVVDDGVVELKSDNRGKSVLNDDGADTSAAFVVASLVGDVELDDVLALLGVGDGGFLGALAFHGIANPLHVVGVYAVLFHADVGGVTVPTAGLLARFGLVGVGVVTVEGGGRLDAVNVGLEVGGYSLVLLHADKSAAVLLVAVHGGGHAKFFVDAFAIVELEDLESDSRGLFHPAVDELAVEAVNTGDLTDSGDVVFARLASLGELGAGVSSQDFWISAQERRE